MQKRKQGNETKEKEHIAAKVNLKINKKERQENRGCWTRSQQQQKKIKGDYQDSDQGKNFIITRNKTLVCCGKTNCEGLWTTLLAHQQSLKCKSL